MILSPLYYVLAFGVSDPPAVNAEHSPLFLNIYLYRKMSVYEGIEIIKIN